MNKVKIFEAPQITVYSLEEDDKEYLMVNNNKYRAHTFELKDVIISELDLTSEQIKRVLNVKHDVEIKKIIEN